MRSKKNKIIIAMCIAVLFMATGYAILSSQLNIRGISKLTDTWGIKITNITSSATGRAYNIAEPSYTDTSMTFKVGVKEPGDKMTFTVTVENTGTLDAILDEINATATGNDKIIYTINGIQEKTKLLAGSTKTFTITTEFDINATSLPTDPVKDLNVELIFIQDDGQTLTPSNPSIDENITHGSLASVVLANNAAKPDTDIDFVHGSFKYGHYWMTRTKSPEQISINQNSTYTFGSRYGYDLITGTYKVGGSTISGKWSEVASRFKDYPYTCLFNSQCSVMYTMTDYISSNAGMAFVHTMLPNLKNNGFGLLYTSNNTEDGKTTYYFRGDVENNYVKFEHLDVPNSYVCLGGDCFEDNILPSLDVCLEEVANGAPWGEEDCVEAKGTNDLLWRIVRINEDGSVRLVTEEVVDYVPFNSSDDDNAHVGYMYGNINSSNYLLTHTNTYDSTIKRYLDSWYQIYVQSYYELLSLNTGFCNDRSIASAANTWESEDTALGYGQNITYYGADYRNTGAGLPKFNCPNASNDLFTTKNSNKGNKKLSYPIGLLTMDEYVYAGGSWDDISPNYLTTGANGPFWTMSPGNFYDDANVFVVEGADPYPDYASTNYGVRPVINLKEDVKITGGNGTKDNPYVIGTN